MKSYMNLVFVAHPIGAHGHTFSINGLSDHCSWKQEKTSPEVMRSFSALLFSVLIAASWSTSLALVSMPLTKLERTGSYLQGAPHADRERASFLKSQPSSGPKTIPASNLAYVQYTTSVGVGSPATYYDLVVDTGSSITFVGSVLL